MATIFVNAVKQLIKERLVLLINEEHTKAQPYVSVLGISVPNLIYVPALAQKQKNIISALDDKIITFEGVTNDLKNTKQLIAFINTARADIKEIRELHKVPVNEGSCISCLDLLARNMNDLYEKILALKTDEPELYTFDMLNTVYEESPRHVMSVQLIHYHGEQIFSPQGSDPDTRKNKETALAKRIRAFNERVQKDTPLETQKTQVSECLEDLRTDNGTISKGQDSLVKTVVGKLTFFGFGVNKALVGTGEGRLGILIDSTGEKIARLKLPDQPSEEELKLSADEDEELSTEERSTHSL